MYDWVILHCIYAPSWRRAWRPITAFLTRKPRGERNMAGYSPWGNWQSDTIQTPFTFSVTSRGFIFLLVERIGADNLIQTGTELIRRVCIFMRVLLFLVTLILKMKPIWGFNWQSWAILSASYCIWLQFHPSAHKTPRTFAQRFHLWVNLLSRVQLFMTPWTVAYQAPLFMGFSRQ